MAEKLHNEYNAGPEPKFDKGEFDGIGSAIPLPDGALKMTKGAIYGNHGCGSLDNVECDKLSFPDKNALPVDRHEFCHESDYPNGKGKKV